MPPRKVDERKTRKALRKLRRAVDAAEGGAGAGDDKAKLSDWEKEFAQSVEKRLETYGSAFTDPSKGALEEPLSARQAAKLTEIGRKARGKGQGLKRSGPIKPKRKLKPAGRGSASPKAAGKKARSFRKAPARTRDIAEEGAPDADRSGDDAPDAAASRPAPRLRIIKGGLEE